MKSSLIFNIQNKMKSCLSQSQFLKLTQVLVNELNGIDVTSNEMDSECFDNFELLDLFLSAKKVEGCSLKTIQLKEPFSMSGRKAQLGRSRTAARNVFASSIRHLLPRIHPNDCIG